MKCFVKVESYCFEMMDSSVLADWATVLFAVAAIYTLFLTVRALKNNSTAADFSSYVELRKIWSNAWREFRNAPREDRRYEFQELMGTIENLCHLHNKSKLSDASEELIREWMVEILPGIFSNTLIEGELKNSFSSERTYENIYQFSYKFKLYQVNLQLDKLGYRGRK